MKTQSATASPCTPISHISGTALPVRRTEITTFVEDYQQPDALQATHTAAADLRVIKCVTGLTHRQEIHTLLQRKHKPQKDRI